MRIHEIDNKSLALFNKYKSSIQLAAERYNNKHAIYRGIKASKEWIENINFIDPAARKTPRKSANTHNYYTLWIDNSSQWQKFPKRSLSLICTTDIQTTYVYGTTFVVIPVVDATIGVCPDSDLWYSFDKTLPVRVPGDMLNDLMNGLHVIFVRQKIAIPETYPELVAALQAIDVEAIPDTWRNIKKLFQAVGPQQAMDKIFDPNANGFDLQKWSTFSFPRSREVWLSDPCLMIDGYRFKEIADGSHPDFKL